MVTLCSCAGIFAGVGGDAAITGASSPARATICAWAGGEAKSHEHGVVQNLLVPAVKPCRERDWSRPCRLQLFNVLP